MRYGNNFKPFSGEPVLPRQLEVHLSNPTGIACNSECIHCQGQNLETEMANFDEALFSLIKKLNGAIPRIVFSGLYTEPTINRNLIDMIELVKATGSSFGLHTNGVLLEMLEGEDQFISRLFRVADNTDYLSISLDAGSPESFALTKDLDKSIFFNVIDALQKCVSLKETEGLKGPVVRLTYLLNKHNSELWELERAKGIAETLGAQSLRFSVPYAPFGLHSLDYFRHRKEFELPLFHEVWNSLARIISKDADERPNVFAMPPETQSVVGKFRNCFSGYDSIVLGVDGYFYRCCSVAHNLYKHLRLGPIADGMDLLEYVGRNQDRSFNPHKSCFSKGARCTRASMEINTAFGATLKILKDLLGRYHRDK
jgi:MoaA/NifB/PqqE/SkfB family radical SAM enzyme